MKSVRKAIIAALCAGTLIVGSVTGTMAYLTSQDEVVNTFTVGNVAIALDEAKVDLNGVATTPAERVDANKYKLMPGHSYSKDPIVHVAGDSEDSYLFVKVENGISAIEGDNTIAAQMAAKGWVAVDGVTNVYVYTQNGAPVAVNGGANVTVFENFTVSGTVEGAALEDCKDSKITVTAYAVQADGFAGKTAAEIWTAAFGA